jgi:hypothetical protein
VRRCLFGYKVAHVRNPSRKVNSGASDRQHHSDPIFGRNAQKAVMRDGLPNGPADPKSSFEYWLGPFLWPRSLSTDV